MCWLATRTRKSVSLSRTKQLLLHRTFNIPGTYNHLPMVPNYLLVLDSLVGERERDCFVFGWRAGYLCVGYSNEGAGVCRVDPQAGEPGPCA